MDHVALVDLLAVRLASHPIGRLANGARMGAALHSEDLSIVDLVALDAQAPWEARRAEGTDTQAEAFTSPEDASRFRPGRFGASALYALDQPLTLETFPATPFVHKKGGLYQGVAVAFLDRVPHAVYTDADGVWWIRPWSMFADGRFHRGPAQKTHWIGCLAPHAPDGA